MIKSFTINKDNIPRPSSIAVRLGAEADEWIRGVAQSKGVSLNHIVCEAIDFARKHYDEV